MRCESLKSRANDVSCDQGMGTSEKFHPDPSMVRLYYTYLLLALVLPLAVATLVTLLVYFVSPRYLLWAGLASFAPIVAVFCFVAYWIPRYYRSIIYELTPDEVRVERGVFWKMRHAVPYARVMSIDTVQGPISRRFGIGTVDAYTAGYTGPAGGSSGPIQKRAEASIMHIANFLEVRESILSVVRARPLFGAAASDVGSEMLRELRRIREAVEEKV